MCQQSSTEPELKTSSSSWSKSLKTCSQTVSMLDLVQVLDQRQQKDNVEDTFFFILNYFATKKNPSLHDKPEVFCTTLFSDTWISPLLLHFRLHTPPLPGCGPTSMTSQCPEICSRPRTRLMSSWWTISWQIFQLKRSTLVIYYTLVFEMCPTKSILWK